MNQSAQGLASLGRGNDSMLVHMTPREVEGLQGLAMAHGGSLTINPQTGLPEAGFLDSILPTVAGLGLNAMFPGLGALGTGLLVGGVTALASGDLGKGVLAGFGAGSGAGLGKTFASMGKSAVGGIPGSEAIGAVGKDIVGQLPENVAQNAATNLGMFNSQGATAAMGGVGGATVPTISQAASTLGDATSNFGMFNTGATGATSALAPSASQIAQSQLAQPSLLGDARSRLGDMGEGFKQFAKDPFGAGYDAFKEAGGSTMDLLSPVASVGMEALKPEPYPGYEDPDKGKYRGSEGQLNLSDKFDTNLRLIAKGGYIKNYALGGAVNPNPSVGGGLSDLYNRPEGQTPQNISSNAYGLSRLSDLGSEQARYQAQTLGYAMGGPVSFADGGNTEKGMNLDGLPSLNVNTGEQSMGGGSSGEEYKLKQDLMNAYQKQSPYTRGLGSQQADFEGLLKAFPSKNSNIDYSGLDMLRTPGKLATLDDLRRALSFAGEMYERNPSLDFAKNMYDRSAITKMAQGGYLNGAGDGMSDSIPATIEGKQPARLADGEFVVPADVVSHLGNGSSKAGSKRLYAMLDKVRHARTGHTKQGKQIKAEKYLPA